MFNKEERKKNVKKNNHAEGKCFVRYHRLYSRDASGNNSSQNFPSRRGTISRTRSPIMLVLFITYRFPRHGCSSTFHCRLFNGLILTGRRGSTTKVFVFCRETSEKRTNVNPPAFYLRRGFVNIRSAN